MSSRSSGTVVDSKVVEMSFDNSNFESNAKESISTIEKLKQALNFTNSTKGLEDINSSVKNIKFDSLNAGIDSVKASFGALDSISHGFFTRLGNDIYDKSIAMVKLFTTGPINDGFKEFELKMGSIQTILMGAKTDAGLPVTLDMVNEQLDALNHYADKTIYSFSDMTSNIGKFTNAGVGLETAVQAIQGIANEAALSGANAQQASHAMYNFAQALSSGYVKLIDWKSIENAQMATVEFKDALIDAGLAVGTLVEQEGMLQSTTTDANGHVSDLFDSTRGFNDSLSSQWMTTEVLTMALARYADETDELGAKATEAATKVRTFTQLMDTLKEAAGSGWAKSFEIIFGDFDQATEIFTTLSKRIGGALDYTAARRNAYLQEAFQAGSSDKLISADDWKNLNLSAGQAHLLADELREIAKLNGVAFKDDSLMSFTESLNDGWLTGSMFAEAMDKLTGTANSVDTTESVEQLENLHEMAMQVIRGDWKEGQEREDLLTAAGYNYDEIQGYVNKLSELSGGTWDITDAMLEEADAYRESAEAMSAKSDEELKELGWTEDRIQALRELQAQAEQTGTPLNDLWTSNMEKMTGWELMFDSLKMSIKGLRHIFKPIYNAFDQVFPPGSGNLLYDILVKINQLAHGFENLTRTMKKPVKAAFVGIFSIVKVLGSAVKLLASAGFSALTAAITPLVSILGTILSTAGNVLTVFSDWVTQNEVLTKAFNAITGVLDIVRFGIVETIKDFLGLSGVTDVMDGVKTKFESILGNIKSFFGKFGDGIVEFFDRVQAAVDAFNSGTITVGDVLGTVGSAFKDFIKKITGLDILKNLKQTVLDIKDAFVDWFFSLQTNADGSLNVFQLALKGILFVLLAMVSPIALVVGGIYLLVNAIKSLGDKLDIGSKLKAAFAPLKKQLPEFLEGLRDKIIEFKNKIITPEGINFKNIGKIFGTFKDTVISYITNSNIAKTIGNIFDTIRQTIFAGAVGLFDQFGIDLPELLRKIAEPFSKLKEVVENFSLSGILTKIKEFLFPSKDGLGDGKGLAEVIAETADKTGAALDKTKNIWDRAFDLIVSIAETMTSRMADIVKALPSLKEVIWVIAGIAAVIAALNAKKIVDFFTAIPKASAKELNARAMLEQAAAIGILVAAVAGLAILIGKGYGGEIIAALAAIAGLMIAMTAMSVVMNKLNEGGQLQKTGLAMVEIAGSILLLAAACALMSRVSWGDMGKVALALVGLLAIVGIFSAAMGKAGVQLAAFNLGILGLTASMWLLTGLMIALNAVSWDLLLGGMVKMIPVAAAMGMVLLATKAAGENAKGAGIAAIGLAASIVLIAGAMLMLSLLDWGGLAKASVGLLVIGVVLGGLLAVSKLAEKSAPSIVALAVLMGVIAGTFVIMAFIPESAMEKVLNAFKWIGLVLSAILATSSFASQSKGALALLVLVMVAIGALFYVMKDIEAEQLNAISNALIKAFAGLSLLMVAAAAAGTFAGAAVKGLAIMALAIAAIAGIAFVIGTLVNKFDESGAMMASLETGFDVLIFIAEGIGRIIGAFIGGLAAQATSYLPEIAESVKGFFEVMQELNGVGPIDMTPLDQAMQAVLKVSLVGFANSILSMITEAQSGVSAAEQFANDLTALADAFAHYQLTMALFDDIKIDTTGLDNAISELQKALGTQSIGKLFTDWLAPEDKTAMDQFSEDLSKLAGAMKDWAEQTKDMAALTVDTEGIDSLVTALEKIPSSGGLFGVISGFLTGKPDFDEFKKQVKKLGEAVSEYSNSLGDVDDKKLSAASRALNALSTLGTTLKGMDLTGGWGSDGDFVEFGNQLVKLGGKLNEFANTITTASKIDTISSTIRSLKTAVSNIDEIDLTSGDIADAGAVKTFASNIKILKNALTPNNMKVGDAGDLVSTIKQLNSIELTDNSETAGAAAGAFKIGAAICDKMIKGVNSKKKTVVDAITKAVTEGVNAIKKAERQFASEGAELMKSLAAGITNATQRPVNAVTAMTNRAVAALKNIRSAFESAGRYVAEGFAAGIRANEALAAKAAMQMGRRAASALKAVEQIQSPSKVTAGIGRFFVLGFANAIVKYSRVAVDAAKDFGHRSAEGLNDAVDMLNDILAMDIDTEPVIRPVLDLRDLRSGAKNISKMVDLTPTVGISNNISAINGMTNTHRAASAYDMMTMMDMLKGTLNKPAGNTYIVNGITYDDGTNVASAVSSLIRAARVERRV